MRLFLVTSILAASSACTKRMTTEIGTIEIFCLGVCVAHSLHAQRSPWQPRIVEEEIR